MEVQNDDATGNPIDIADENDIADEAVDELIDGERDEQELAQNVAVSYLMNLREFHKTTEKTTESVATGTNAFVERALDSMRRRVAAVLQHHDTEQNILQEIDGLFENTDLPFDGLITSYERNKYIREHFSYVDPEYVPVGQRLGVVKRRGARSMEVLPSGFYYIPIISSIQQFLQNDKVCDLVFQRPNYGPDGFLSDLCDGSIFRHHMIFGPDDTALQLLLYYDDLEICNPIGKSSGMHKIGIFYYMLGNLPAVYRSRLPAVRLIAVVKRTTMNSYGINIVLDRILQDLQTLSEGVMLHLSNGDIFLRGAVTSFIGDTLAAHEFSGFKMGVGFAYQKCRECECTYEDMQTKFHENQYIKRSLHRYDEQCSHLSEAATEGMRARLSTAFGINQRTTARDFPHFDVTTMVPQDIMHVLFEGVAQYEICEVLKELVQNQGTGISLQTLNYQLENFPYGYKDGESRPCPLPTNFLDGTECSLRQSSSSMIVLMRLLPLMLDTMGTDFEDEHVRFLLELCDIVKILLAPVITIETIEYLRFIIAKHLRSFKYLFADKAIIPKQHYMVHLPSAIERYGPLIHVWCMRFEGKHQFIKQRMAGNKNFRNVEKSISEKTAMYECALNANGTNHPLFTTDCIIGKSSRIRDIEHCKRTIQAFFGIPIESITSVHEVSWVTLNGQKYKARQCVIAFGENGGLPEFGHLQFIWVSNEIRGTENEQNIYFGLQMYETVGYDENILGYAVTEPMVAQGPELIHSSNIFVHCPLHLYKGSDRKYVVPPYDMDDLVQLKMNESLG